MLILILVPARVSNWSSLDASALWMEPFTTWYFRMFAKAVVSLWRPSRVDWGSLEKAAFVGAKMVYSPINTKETQVINDVFTYILTWHKNFSKKYIYPTIVHQQVLPVSREQWELSPRHSVKLPPDFLQTHSVQERSKLGKRSFCLVTIPGFNWTIKRWQCFMVL